MCLCLSTRICTRLVTFGTNRRLGTSVSPHRYRDLVSACGNPCRYLLVCFLQVTFAVLVFPPEHHALGFAVASAATGSCVLKLGLGGLLGESGEIFKILDDPLGDRCHASRFALIHSLHKSKFNACIFDVEISMHAETNAPTRAFDVQIDDRITTDFEVGLIPAMAACVARQGAFLVGAVA